MSNLNAVVIFETYPRFSLENGIFRSALLQTVIKVVTPVSRFWLLKGHFIPQMLIEISDYHIDGVLTVTKKYFHIILKFFRSRNDSQTALVLGAGGLWTFVRMRWIYQRYYWGPFVSSYTSCTYGRHIISRSETCCLFQALRTTFAASLNTKPVPHFGTVMERYFEKSISRETLLRL